MQHQEGILQKISSVKALSKPKLKLHLLDQGKDSPISLFCTVSKVFVGHRTLEHLSWLKDICL